MVCDCVCHWDGDVQDTVGSWCGACKHCFRSVNPPDNGECPDSYHTLKCPRCGSDDPREVYATDIYDGCDYEPFHGRA